MSYLKNSIYIVCFSTVLSLTACQSITPVQDPKMALQKGIQPLLSKSYEFETIIDFDSSSQATSKQAKQQEEGKERAEDIILSHLLAHTQFYTKGAYDHIQKKTSAQANLRTKTDHIYVNIKTATLLTKTENKENNIVLDVRDFNPQFSFLMPEKERLAYQNKYVRFSLPKSRESLSIEEIKQLFDSIDETAFVSVPLDKKDRQLGGKTKIRINLSQQQLEKLFPSTRNHVLHEETFHTEDEEETPSTSQAQLTDNPILFSMNVVLNSQGDIVRLTNNKLDDTISSAVLSELYYLPSLTKLLNQAKNINVQVNITQYGSVSLPFNPDEASIVDFKTKNLETLDHNDSEEDLRQIYDKIAMIKMPVEMAIFEGKKPVSTQAQAKKIKNSQFIESPSDEIRLTIQQNSKKPDQVTVTATFKKPATQAFIGTRFMFKRDAIGQWHCTFYTGGKKEIDTSSIESLCSINTKSAR
ncbi:pilin [Neisseria sp. Ec49-e6-T10]|uniref:pilin n=1 Tax=Neisseria sp. Ec49-e6-T10 TaxID=3140744 RepID=UPI003EB6D816